MAALQAAGVVVGATRAVAGAEVLKLPDHPFYVVSMFQPHIGASRGAPIHPLGGCVPSGGRAGGLKPRECSAEPNTRASWPRRRICESPANVANGPPAARRRANTLATLKGAGASRAALGSFAWRDERTSLHPIGGLEGRTRIEPWSGQAHTTLVGHPQGLCGRMHKVVVGALVSEGGCSSCTEARTALPLRTCGTCPVGAWRRMSESELSTLPAAARGAGRTGEDGLGGLCRVTVRPADGPALLRACMGLNGREGRRTPLPRSTTTSGGSASRNCLLPVPLTNRAHGSHGGDTKTTPGDCPKR